MKVYIIVEEMYCDDYYNTFIGSNIAGVYKSEEGANENAPANKTYEHPEHGEVVVHYEVFSRIVFK